MKHTEEMKLNLPEQSDFFDIIHFNENSEKVEAEIKKLTEETEKLKETAFSGDYNDLSGKPTVNTLGAVARTGDTMTGGLTLRPKTGEGGEIFLAPAENHPEQTGIRIDQCTNMLRFFGEPSADGSVTDSGTPLVIDVYGKTIKGDYTFYGNQRVSSLLIPNATDTVDIGSFALRFRNVHANNMRLKGSGNYGSKLNFGDGDLVYLHEDTDDHLLVHASKGVEIDSKLDIEDMSVGGKIIGGTWKQSDSSNHGIYWSSATVLRPVSENNRPSLGSISAPFNFVCGSVFYEDGVKIRDKYAVAKNGKKSNPGTGGWVQNDITFGVTYKDIPLVSIQQTNASIDSSVYLDNFFGDATNGYTGFRYWVYCPNTSWTYKTSWFAIGNTK